MPMARTCIISCAWKSRLFYSNSGITMADIKVLFMCLILISYLSLSNGQVKITNGPEADKNCYEENDEGMLTISYQLTNDNDFLDDYKVVWKFHTTVLIDGPNVLIYNGYPTEKQLKEHARWICTIEYKKRTVTYNMKIKAMQTGDDQGELRAHIIRISTGDTVATSANTVAINVYNEDCPPPSRYTTPAPSATCTTQPTEEHHPTFQIISQLFEKIKKGAWYAVPVFLLVANVVLSIIILGLLLCRLPTRQP